MGDLQEEIQEEAAAKEAADAEVKRVHAYVESVFARARKHKWQSSMKSKMALKQEPL